MWMNQGGVESTEHSICFATWPLCNKSLGEQLFFPKWGLSSLFSCETWQVGHSESDRPLLCSSADNSFTQMSAETFTGARRGSELLSQGQPRERHIPQLSADPTPSQQHPCKSAQLQWASTEHRRGKNWLSMWSWLREFPYKKFTKEEKSAFLWSFLSQDSGAWKA